LGERGGVAVVAASVVVALRAVAGLRTIVAAGLLAIVVVALPMVVVASLPPGAEAQTPGSSPFSPGLPLQSTTTPTTTPTIVQTATSSSGSGGLSGTSAVLIAAGAIVVLGGISLFIWRDARRRAPVRHRAHADVGGVGGRSGSKAPPKPRKLSPAERRRRKRGRAR
jgi:hypothetical protein